MDTGLIIKTPPLDVFSQMGTDEFFCEIRPAKYILRFYNWASEGITFGLSQNYAFVSEKIAAKGKTEIPITRRPTGGGIVYHESDITFSLIFPSQGQKEPFDPVQTYSALHNAILREYKKNGVSFDILDEKTANYETNNPVMECFEKPVSMDLMSEGRKMLGGALRKFLHYILYQGSLQLPDARLKTDFHQKVIAKALANEFNIRWNKRIPNAFELKRMKRIAESKFLSDKWIKRL